MLKMQGFLAAIMEIGVDSRSYFLQQPGSVRFLDDFNMQPDDVYHEKGCS